MNHAILELDDIPDAFIRFDAERIVKAWNCAAERLYGISAPAAVGRRIDDLFGREPSAGPEQSSNVGTTALVRRVTETFSGLVETSRTARRSQSGAIVDVMEISRPVATDDKIASQMAAARDRFDNLFQALAVGFFEVDFRAVGAELLRLHQQGIKDLRAHLLARPSLVREILQEENVLTVNAACVEMFGASGSDELTGRGSSRFWPDESLPDYVAAVMAVIDKRSRFVCETRLRALDGSLIDVLFTVAWSEESARRGIMIIGVVDLRAQKKAFSDLQTSEAKYRRLFDAMSIGFLELDFRAANSAIAAYGETLSKSPRTEDEGWKAQVRAIASGVRLTASNQRALDILGFDDLADAQAALSGKWDRVSLKTIEHLALARLRHEQVHQAETRFHLSNGRPIICQVTFWSPFDSSPDAPVLCGIVDITKRIEDERRIDHLRDEFAHASRVATVGQLSVSVAHEISQPLSAIMANMATAVRTMARDPAPDPELMRSLVDHTAAAAGRAADIVSRIRSMASPVVRDLEPVVLGDVLTEALTFVRHEIEAAQADVRIDHGPAGLRVVGNRIQIQQIIVNFVLNALQAMNASPRSPRMDIAIGSDGTCASLSVSDNGIGFSPTMAGELFSSFYTTKPEGMGVGLAVSQSIAEAHHGRIDAASLDPGARFTLRIPVARTD